MLLQILLYRSLISKLLCIFILSFFFKCPPKALMYPLNPSHLSSKPTHSDAYSDRALDRIRMLINMGCSLCNNSFTVESQSTSVNITVVMLLIVTMEKTDFVERELKQKQKSTEEPRRITCCSSPPWLCHV